MNTTIVDKPDANRLEMYDGEARTGFLDYRLADGELALLHTEIDSAYEGAGLGSTLARHALDDARANGRQVLPHCPFIRDWISRHPDYIDLVPEARRQQFEL